MAMVSSLVRRAVPSEMLFVGDVDLGGGIRDVTAPIIDGLNDAIDTFAVETPITVVLAPDSATWLRTSSTVRANSCRSLVHAVASVWPNTAMIPS
jgi:predicted ATP-dependent serine protease